MEGQGTTSDQEVDGTLPFLVLDFCLDIVNGVRRFDLEGDGFASKPAQTVRTKEYLRRETHVLTKICMPAPSIYPTRRTMESSMKA